MTKCIYDKVEQNTQSNWPSENMTVVRPLKFPSKLAAKKGTVLSATCQGKGDIRGLEPNGGADNKVFILKLLPNSLHSLTTSSFSSTS